MDSSAQRRASINANLSILTVDSVVRSVTRVLLRAPIPFAIQNGEQMLLLDADDESWHFAEMRYQSPEDGYVQVRRAEYESPREAIGALLSRALVGGDEVVIDTVVQLHDYLMRHYQIPVINC